MTEVTPSQPIVPSISARMFWIGVYASIPGFFLTLLGGAITWYWQAYGSIWRGIALGGTAGAVVGNLWVLADPMRLSFLGENKLKWARRGYVIGSVLALVGVFVQSWAIIQDIRSVAPLRAVSAAAVRSVDIHVAGSFHDRPLDDPGAIASLVACLHEATFRASHAAPTSGTTVIVHLRRGRAVTLTCGVSTGGETVAAARLSGVDKPVFCAVPGLRHWFEQYDSGTIHSHGTS